MSTVTEEMLASISQRFTQAQAQAKVEDTKRREVQAAIEQHRAEEARAVAAQQQAARAKAAEAAARVAARGVTPPAAPAARPSGPPATARGVETPPTPRPSAPPQPRPGTPPKPVLTGPQAGLAGRRQKGRKKPQVDQRAVLQSFQKTMAELEGPRRRRRRRTHDSGVAVEESENLVQAVEMMPLHDLAQELGVRPQELIQKCLKNGVMATMNTRLDRDTIEFLVADYGYELEFVTEFEDDPEETAAVETEALPRPPVVTIMGHVDHGKTSILDYIRKSKVIAGEAGGITQHIGAYEVSTPTGHQVTFPHTPGHEAFTAMRARGAQVTDLVVIVVAANDGVMPQTVEAINHARAAGVPFMIAINKIDLPDANVDRVKQQLTQHSILIEEYGGTVVACPVSAKKGTGIDQLLEMINLQAELLELKAPRAGRARGVVLEARKTAQHGVVANVLVQQGTLRVGQVFVAGRHAGRVRALLNERGRRVETVGPADPVQVLGCVGTPQAGDPFTVVEHDRQAREIASRRQQYARAREAKAVHRVTLEQLYQHIKDGGLNELRLVLKGDVDGSVEALSESLEKLATPEVGVRVIHRGVGGINETDVTLAAASNAIVVGFHVRPNAAARELAKREGVDLHLYEVIY